MYKEPRKGPEAIEGIEESIEGKSDVAEKSIVHKGKYKTTISGGSRGRGAKRNLQGKIEVCHPFMAKRTKFNLSNVASEEEETSEATSPIKYIPKVEAAGQSHREP
ncbi:hypothetical protein V6N13_019953 [Hibiscus sabdariffa]|uniref:Uncharacterized protein n=1 Tax=Hibiscus sabdariffa TaxID=183260 RepID=A0ABR2ERZ5_9ROSI